MSIDIVTRVGNGNARLESHCRFCGSKVEITAPEKEMLEWQFNGKLNSPVQKIFTTLATEEREFLISKICPHCQEKIFGCED